MKKFFWTFSVVSTFLDPKCNKWIEYIIEIIKKIKKINEILLNSIFKFDWLLLKLNLNSVSSISIFKACVYVYSASEYFLSLY